MVAIQLINCDPEILKTILEGNDQLSQKYDWIVPHNWSTFGMSIFEYALKKITEKPLDQKWWTYLPILKSTNTLIGSCGFKGPPDEYGRVEIGYEVSESFQNKGYASEMARQLIAIAFDQPEVQSVIAHTLAEENASVAVLKKNNFNFELELEDEEEGTIWRWKRPRH